MMNKRSLVVDAKDLFSVNNAWLLMNGEHAGTIAMKAIDLP